MLFFSSPPKLFLTSLNISGCGTCLAEKTMSTTLAWLAEYSKWRWDWIVAKIIISISQILLLRMNGYSSPTPWTTSGSELTLTLSAGGPASDQVTQKCLRQVSFSLVTNYLNNSNSKWSFFSWFRFSGDNPWELSPGPRGSPLHLPGHWQLPAGAGARARHSGHHRPPELHSGSQETGASHPRRGQIIQIISVSSPGEFPLISFKSSDSPCILPFLLLSSSSSQSPLYFFSHPSLIFLI